MKTVLLIEDNADLRENTSELLALADYKVETAENGKTGVERAKTLKPDIIICDIMMPELDGYGVLNILNRNPETSAIPFLFLTAKSEKADFRKAMNLGADDYITKPFEETELIDAIETRLKRNQVIKTDSSQNMPEEPGFINEAKGWELLNKLTEDRKIKVFRKKEEVYRQDDYANYLYFVISGKVKSVKTDTYGKVIVNSIHGANTFIGYTTLLEDGDYHETVIAMSDAELAVIPKTDFVELVRRNRDVAYNLLKLLTVKLREKENRILQLAYAPVRERVAAALLMLGESAEGDSDKAEIEISREDLANIVGTAKESLIRMLSDLKKDGLIEISGSSIRILDKKSLKQISCE